MRSLSLFTGMLFDQLCRRSRLLLAQRQQLLWICADQFDLGIDQEIFDQPFEPLA